MKVGDIVRIKDLAKSGWDERLHDKDMTVVINGPHYVILTSKHWPLKKQFSANVNDIYVHKPAKSIVEILNSE